MVCARYNVALCRSGSLPYRTATKSTLICFHSMHKGLGLGLGWQSDSVVFPADLAYRLSGPADQRQMLAVITWPLYLMSHPGCVFPSTESHSWLRPWTCQGHVGLYSGIIYVMLRNFDHTKEALIPPMCWISCYCWFKDLKQLLKRLKIHAQIIVEFLMVVFL